jgi:hypothetical protein
MINTGIKNARPLSYVSNKTATAQIKNMIDFTQYAAYLI